MKYDVLEKKLGSVLLNALEKAEFKPPVKGHPDCALEFHLALPLTNPIYELEHRAAVSSIYHNFFHELAGKIETLALESTPNLDVELTFEKNFTDYAKQFLEKSFSGDPQYLPHLNLIEPPVIGVGERYIELHLAAMIFKVPKRMPTLLWYVSARAWVVNKENSKLSDFIGTIETSNC